MPQPAGYSGTPLRQKLGLKRGMSVRLLGAPADYWTTVAVDPGEDDLDLLSAAGGEAADFTHIFATELEPLRASFARARAAMAQNGMVWASWPKRSSGRTSGIGQSEVMAAGKEAGLVDVKVCAVDATWSGLKFVIPIKDRPR